MPSNNSSLNLNRSSSLTQINVNIQYGTSKLIKCKSLNNLRIFSIKIFLSQFDDNLQIVGLFMNILYSTE